MNLMRIAVFNEFFSPYVTGGTEIFLKEFCSYLEKKKHEILLFTSYLVKGETGFKTYRIKSSPVKFNHMQQIPGITAPFLLFNKNLERWIEKIMKKENVDMVYLNNIYHLSFSPITAAIKSRLPVILDVHDYWPVCFAKDMYYLNKKFCEKRSTFKCSFCLFSKFRFPVFFSLPFLKIEKIWRRKLLEKIEKIIVHSNFVKQVLQEAEEFENKEINVIPYPLMISAPEKIKKPEIEKELKLLFAGRVDFHKGADLLLEIAKSLKEHDINLRIDVLGRGKLTKALERKDLNIYVHGFLGKERFKFFEKAHFLIAPSRWPEPFGIVALEGAAYDTPVITLETSGGLAEIVKENGIGILVRQANIGEKVAQLVSDYELYRKLKKNCRKIKKKYSRIKIFERYVKVFRE